MSRKIEGTFEKRGRWKFMVDGATHRINCSTLNLPRSKWTKNDSYLLAKAALETKLAALAPVNPNQDLLDLFDARLAANNVLGLPHADALRHVRGQIEAMPDRLPDESQQRQRGLINDRVWQDRIKTAKIKAAPKEKTANFFKTKFLDFYESQANAGEISSGRFGVLANSVNVFVTWFGPARNLDELTKEIVKEYYSYLTKRLATGGDGNASATLWDHWQVAKQFIANTAEDYDTPNPGNLHSKKFKIQKTRKEPDPFTIDEVKLLLANASAKTKTYLMLMLNCGYYQFDVATIHATEVDWKHGRINRCRSKIKKGSDPIKINWCLWDETFELMKQHGNRSGTVFLNANGGPIVRGGVVDGKTKRIDNVKSSFLRLVKKLKNRELLPKQWNKTLKQFRKTGANIIEYSSNTEHSQATGAYLNSATVAKTNYLKSGQISPRFDSAVKWLGEQLGFSTDRS
jgi:integrase